MIYKYKHLLDPVMKLITLMEPGDAAVTIISCKIHWQFYSNDNVLCDCKISVYDLRAAVFAGKQPKGYVVTDSKPVMITVLILEHLLAK